MPSQKHNNNRNGNDTISYFINYDNCCGHMSPCRYYLFPQWGHSMTNSCELNNFWTKFICKWVMFGIAYYHCAFVCFLRSPFFCCRKRWLSVTSTSLLLLCYGEMLPFRKDVINLLECFRYIMHEKVVNIFV